MKSKSGSALVFVIIIFLILTVLGSALLVLALSENSQVKYQENKIKAYYAARAGADALASYLIDKPDELNNVLLKTKNYPATGTIDGRTFEAYVTGTEDQFIIESRSYVDNEEQSVVFLEMIEFDLLDQAIFANELLGLGNNVVINGNIGTNNDIGYGNGIDINGNITLGPSATTVDIEEAEAYLSGDYFVTTLTKPINFPAIERDDFFNNPWPDGVSIDTTGLTPLEGNRYNLYMEELVLNSDFHVSGGGDVHLYVEYDIRILGSTTISTDSDTRLFIYYDKDDSIDINGTPTSNIVLYAPYADVTFAGGGTGGFTGTIICDRFSGTNANDYIFKKGSGTIKDLMIEGVTGYIRKTWSN